jgi:hypothetical protein
MDVILRKILVLHLDHSFNLIKPTGYVMHHQFNTLWTGDADLPLYITTVQDG